VIGALENAEDYRMFGAAFIADYDAHPQWSESWYRAWRLRRRIRRADHHQACSEF